MVRCDGVSEQFSTCRQNGGSGQIVRRESSFCTPRSVYQVTNSSVVCVCVCVVLIYSCRCCCCSCGGGGIAKCRVKREVMMKTREISDDMDDGR